MSKREEVMMKNENQSSELTEFLSDISVGVAFALQWGDPDRIESLAGRLSEIQQKAEKSDEPELALYFQVLHGLLMGEDVTERARGLAGPYRAGYERILRELEEHPPGSGEDTLTDWLTNVTSLVVTTAKYGTHEEREKLAQRLADIGDRASDQETSFQNFIAALCSLLRGEDAHELDPELRSPYREAYQSLLQLLSADDTADFALQSILDRIQHNTSVALEKGDRALRLAVAEALADVEEELPEEEPASHQLRILILGSMALLLDRDVPDRVDSLTGPFAEAWHNIVEASQT